MELLSAATALLAVLCVLNLVLTYGVVRRLRTLGGSGSAGPTELAGTVGRFAVTDASGAPLTAAGLAPGTVVAFLSPGCPPCTALLPRFVDAAGDSGLTSDRIIGVVMPGDDDTAEEAERHAARLGSVATVVTGDAARTVAAAFGVQGFPAVCAVGEQGRIFEVGTDLSVLAGRAVDRGDSRPEGVPS
ncbi:TlpA disulfide reductase family protein [Streptomyces sp. NPDC060194]|uniref:TlpA disulfide reductase family protein n=1 Tax=Streptomyces sp. NPDC060194 TaxID=3347069 RepID=UPI00365B4ACA